MEYPTTPIPSLGSSTETYIPLIKSESDGNYTKVRRRTTKAREKFSLKYNNISFDEFDTLRSFFLAAQGQSFTFTEPMTGVQYTCIMSQESLPKDYATTNTVSTSVELEEV